MKILSKYKDFYDYLTKTYGEDPKVILDRRKFGKPLFVSAQMVELFICGRIYQGWFENDKFYWGDRLNIIADEKPKRGWWNKDKHDSPDYIYKGYGDFTQDIRGRLHLSNSGYISTKPLIDNNEINRHENCPIIIKCMGKLLKYPKLSDLDIASAIPAQEIYLTLCEWLSPKDNIENNQTDKEKILSNGFDAKTSFRKM